MQMRTLVLEEIKLVTRASQIVNGTSGQFQISLTPEASAPNCYILLLELDS